MSTNILILCTHNSARSVLAEAMLGQGRIEIDVGGQILFPGVCKHRSEAVAANGLERVAGRAFRMAIVDDEGDSAKLCQPLAKLGHCSLSRWRILDDLPVAVERQAAGRNGDAALGSADELPHRKGVEEFVGDHQQGALRQFRQVLMPVRARNRFRLRFAEDGAGLDEMDGRIEARRADHPERVGGQGSAAGAELDVGNVAKLARSRPGVGETGADKLPEHLADLRRCREVAARAQRIAGRVIISVAGFHIGFDRDRALGLDSPPQGPLERCQETLADPSVGSTRTRRFLAVSIR